VAFPVDLVPELRWHLKRFAAPGERGLVFVGPKGAPLRTSNFPPRVVCGSVQGTSGKTAW
jgi:hypothetical protein